MRTSRIVVRKYRLFPVQNFVVIPHGAELLHVGTEAWSEPNLYVWAKVNTANLIVQRQVFTVCTDEELQHDLNIQYIGSARLGTPITISGEARSMLHVFATDLEWIEIPHRNGETVAALATESEVFLRNRLKKMWPGMWDF